MSITPNLTKYLTNPKNFETDLHEEVTYLEKNFECRPKKIMCKDGFNFCCDGGSMFYSLPQNKNYSEKELEYTHMNISFPSELDTLIIDFIDDPYNEIKEDMVYKYRSISSVSFAFVPVEIIEKLIIKHGGIKN